MSGIARDVRHRSELWGGQNGGTSSIEVLTFRIERPGMQPVPVQMRALNIEGLVTDGDEVRVDTEQRPGKVLKTKRVENLTTGVPVEAYWYRGWTLAFVVIALLVFVAWMLVIFFVL